MEIRAEVVRGETELWNSLSDQLIERVRYWESRLRDIQDVIHVPATEERPERIVTMLHLSRISPHRRPPSPWIEVFMHEIEDGRQKKGVQTFLVDVVEGSVPGREIGVVALAELLAIMDPGNNQAEVMPNTFRR